MLEKWFGERAARKETDKSSKPVPEEKMSRRTFLTGAAASTGVTLFGANLVRQEMMKETGGGETEISPETAGNDREDIEEMPETSRFLNEIEGYSQLLALRGNEVLFVDETGKPIGGPVLIEAIAGVDPGVLDENGLPIEGIRGQWLDTARARLKEQFPEITLDPDNDLPRQLNVVAQFRNVLHKAEADRAEGKSETDALVLAEKIKHREIETYHDIVNYFASKPVRGAEEYSRIEYIETQVELTGMPSKVADELRTLIPALCVQESGYNNDVTSRSGAKGIFQFMPDTWAQYSDEPLGNNSLITQVEVAGRFISDLYRQVIHWMGEDTVNKLKELAGSEERFHHEVLVPCILNAYNAGAQTIGSAAKLFLESGRDNTVEASEPYSIFFGIAEHAKRSEEGVLEIYGIHAREYVSRIYGHRTALRQLRNSA